MNKALLFITLMFPLQAFAQTTLGDDKAIITAMDIQPQNNLLAAISNHINVEVWDYESQTRVKHWSLDTRGSGLAINDEMLIIAKYNGAIDMYDAHDFTWKASQQVTQGSALRHLKKAGSFFLLSDELGNLYKSDQSSGSLIFQKLLTAPEPITQFDFLTDNNTITTFHPSGKIRLFSIQGQMLREQQIEQRNVLAVTSNANKSWLYTSTTNSKVTLYRINSDNNLVEFQHIGISGWPVSMDLEDNVYAVGTTLGNVLIKTDFGKYSFRLNAIINSVIILPNQLPRIFLAVGTHGAGIKMMSALKMKVD